LELEANWGWRALPWKEAPENLLHPWQHKHIAASCDTQESRTNNVEMVLPLPCPHGAVHTRP